jgi:hypothetical protein
LAKERKYNLKNKKRLFITLSLGLLATIGLIGGLKFSTRANTVAAQQNQTIVVPFKGQIRDGNDRLILRIYDQAVGGAVLFEVTRKVDVSNGVYVALVDVPSEILSAKTNVWLEGSKETEPFTPIGERTQFAIRRLGGGITQAIVCPAGGCASLCFTCGGAYPFFNGAIPLAAGSMPTERGGACAAPLQARADTIPFLCTQ